MKPNPVDVRVLGGEDIAPMRAMLSMFGRAFGEARTFTALQPDDAYLGRLLASSTFIAVAALSEGEVIGGIAAYYEDEPASALYTKLGIREDVLHFDIAPNLR